MIQLHNLSKSFHLNGREKTVVKSANITLPTGAVVALLGRNGAGKSTLLSLIAGSTRPSAGYVTSGGRVSWPVGFSGSFHGDLTGAQNIRFIARIYGVDTEDLIDYVEGFSQLGDDLRQPYRTYSTGMRARLAFGASMGIAFDTYLVDEVTAVGDAVFRERSLAVFQQRLQSAGAIVVSHSIPMLLDICDAGAVLEQGKLHYYSDLAEAIEHHTQNLAGAHSAD